MKVGDTYKNFVLKNQKFETINLEEYIGKQNIVLLFFPFVNTGVCEKELCSTRDNMAMYSKLNAKVFAISVDSSFAQKLWDDKFHFGFDLLSDFNKTVCKDYNCLAEIWAPGKWDYKGVAKRSAFVIDKQGVIQYAEILENPGDEPNYQNIKSVLERLN
ncbi:MAG: redoxin domain-containing protein [Ignavibacteria bacterium]|nr:redoxin domain-containing protein [Ignavibacteria bacterium]